MSLYLWDNPIVKVADQTRIDDKLRPGALPGLVERGQTYRVRRISATTLQFDLLTESEVPVVRPRRVNGRLRGANVKISRDVIAAAIRAERDER